MASLAETGRVVYPQEVFEHYPEMANALRAHMGPNVDVSVTKPGHYTDRTHNLKIDIPEGTNTVVVPGFVSGRFADAMLVHLAETGHTARFAHPDDPRSPRAKRLEFVMSDLEGRGNKPTLTPDGKFIPDAELHYAFLTASMFRDVAMADGMTVLDPHDKVSVEALGLPTTVITALNEQGRYMRERGMLTDNSVIVVPDEGAIGRSLYASEKWGVPVAARIIKKRENGKTRVVDVLGKENIVGKKPIIPDDMLASGGTIFGDALFLIEECGAEGGIGVVTHVKGVPSAWDNVRRNLRKDGPLSELVVTNSTPYHKELTYIPGVHIVDVFPLIGRAMETALEPTQENWGALMPDVFPMMSKEEHLAWLHMVNPDLAPDYQPSGFQQAETTIFTYHQPLRQARS